MAKDPLAPMIAARESKHKATEADCMAQVLKVLADHTEADPLQYDQLLRDFEGKLPIAFPRVFELLLERQYVEFGPDAKGALSHKFVQISARGIKANQTGLSDRGNRGRKAGAKKTQPKPE